VFVHWRKKEGASRGRAKRILINENPNNFKKKLWEGREGRIERTVYAQLRMSSSKGKKDRETSSTISEHTDSKKTEDEKEGGYKVQDPQEATKKGNYSKTAREENRKN